MRERADPTAVRGANLGVIVRRLNAAGRCPAPRWRRRPGLNKSTVSSLVAELVDLGLVHERSPTPGGRRASGAPPRRSRSARATVAVGAEINVDRLAVCLEDLTGAVRLEAAEHVDLRQSSPAPALQRLGVLVERRPAARARRRAARGRRGRRGARPRRRRHRHAAAGAEPGLDAGRRSPRSSPAGSTCTRAGAPSRTRPTCRPWPSSGAARPRGSTASCTSPARSASAAASSSAGSCTGARAASRASSATSRSSRAACPAPAGRAAAWRRSPAWRRSARRRASRCRRASASTPSPSSSRAAPATGDAAAVAALERAGDALGVAVASAVNLLDLQCVILGGSFTPLAPWLARARAGRAVDGTCWPPTTRRSTSGPRRSAAARPCAAPPRPTCGRCSTGRGSWPATATPRAAACAPPPSATERPSRRAELRDAAVRRAAAARHTDACGPASPLSESVSARKPASPGLDISRGRE